MRTGRPKLGLEQLSEPEPMSGCVLWLGAMRQNGYGFLSRGGRTWLAHRLAYEAARGPIPAGMTIDHLCRVRSCINPAHLEPVSRRTNTLRGFGITAQNSRKQTCPRGHNYNWTTSNGTARRYCWPCQKQLRGASR